MMREDWTVEKLGSFVFYEKGKKPSKQQKDPDKIFKFAYIDIEAFEKGVINSYTNGEKCKFCSKDDFLMVWDGSRSGLVGKGVNGALGSTLMRISFPGINNEYAFYFLKSKYIEINTRAKGTGTPHVDPELLWNYDFPIAPLPEQLAIVAKIEQLFSELDNGITNLKLAKDKVEIYRQAVLKKAFEGELTKVWREQQTDLPSAEELLVKIKKEREDYYEKQLKDWKKAVGDWEGNGKVGKKPTKPKIREFKSILDSKEVSELPDLPQKWFYNFLAYSGDLGRGKSKHRPRNDEILFGGKYPFIQTAEVKAQDEITEYSQTYSDFGLSQSKLWPKGTLCITIAANIAETGFLGVDACFPDSVVGFTPFESIVDKRYIDYFFKLAKRKISSWAPATAQKNINLNILENLIIPYCCLKEQIQVISEIETRLSVCDNILANIDEGLEKAEALRQSILKRAFEGKLLSYEELEACRRENNWEPAEKLLERIKQERYEEVKI